MLGGEFEIYPIEKDGSRSVYQGTKAGEKAKKAYKDDFLIPFDPNVLDKFTYVKNLRTN